MFHYFSELKRKFYSPAILFLAAILPFSGTTAAQTQQHPGNIDQTFNGSGKVVTNLGNPDNIAGAVAVQPDGKIVVAGLSGSISSISETPGTSNFVVLRYNADGSLDNSFGGNGRVVTTFGDGEAGAGAVLIQPDGKILVAGSINTKTPNGSVALARFNSNGSADTTFDGDGKLTTDFQQNFDERAEAMILQPDGKIVVVVSTVRENVLEDQAYVARYNADGSPDVSFAGDGTTGLPFVIPGGVFQGITASDVALQPDGKIVVAGTVVFAQGSDFFVWRFNADGTNDQTFGGRAVTASFNTSDNAVSIFVQPDNKIFVAGDTLNNTNFRNDFAFARFNQDGTPDGTFDGDGKKTTSYADAEFTVALDFEMLPGGKIVSVGGTLLPTAPTDSNFAVTRFDVNGNLDPTFDSDGKVVTSFGNGNDVAFAAAIQSGGKIIAAGGTETNIGTDNYNIAIARYIGEGGNAPRKTEFDFDGDGKSDISVFRAAERSEWYFLRSGSNDAFAGVQWGTANDRIAPADYDGDGKSDFAVFRRGNGGNENRSYFYILNSSNNTFRAEQFGNSSDVPWSGDWDGDGRADLAVYRTGVGAGGQSHFIYRPSLSQNNDFVTIEWGVTTDEPMRGDFDGDGKLDAAVARGGNWFIRQSSNGTLRSENWGIFPDRWVPADYDGDGKTDVAVFRNGVWYIKQSSNNQPRYVSWGLNTDRPVPADYDGDGKADPAVYRSGVWYLLRNANGETKTVNFGLPEDRPVPTAYLRQPIVLLQ